MLTPLVEGLGPLWARGAIPYLAETLVVKAAHSLAYTSLVVPVMSSHWAWSVPPVTGAKTGWGTAFRWQTQSLARC